MNQRMAQRPDNCGLAPEGCTLIVDGHYRAKIDDLRTLASGMGVAIEWRDLGGTRAGQYHDGRDLIVLNSRLRDFQVPSVLGHELAHAMFRDRGSSARAEIRARIVGYVLSLDPVAVREGRWFGVESGRVVYDDDGERVLLR